MHSEKPRMSPAEEHWPYHPGPSAGGGGGLGGGASLHVQPWRALVSLGVAQSGSGGVTRRRRDRLVHKGGGGRGGAPAGWFPATLSRSPTWEGVLAFEVTPQG